MAEKSKEKVKDKTKQENARPKEKRKESTKPSGLRAGNELLLLWAILGEGGGKVVAQAELDKKGMLPSNAAQVREGLVERRLITAEERKTLNEQGRRVKGIWMTVTDAGLAWAEENLAAVPAKSQAAAPILQAWLARLSVLLQLHNIPIAEFLAPHRGDANSRSGIGLAETPASMLHEDSPAAYRPAPSPLNGDYDALRARIRQAYLAVTGNRVNTRARLHNIRGELNDIDPGTLEAALKRMQREQQAILYPLDNKSEITDADRDAAINFGGEPCHILWIER